MQISFTMSHLAKEEVSGVRFQKGKTGELTPLIRTLTPDTKNTQKTAQTSDRPWIADPQSNKVTK